MKSLFDRKAKNRDFLPNDLFLKWDARREDLEKHGKFDHIRYSSSEGKNLFLLDNLDGETLSAPVNGHYLKNYMQ
jgi:hypothetical protein